MPNEVFRDSPKFGVTVAGKPSSTPPAGGFPVGPHGFPSPPVPPPPPPPEPLAILSVVSDGFFGVNVYKVEFDGPPVVTAVPNWIVNGGDPILLAGVGNSAPNTLWCFFDQILGSEIVVPADATGVLSLTGGAVVPGTYPVT